MGVGKRTDLEEFYKSLQTTFIVKKRGVLGPAPQELKEIRILNRVLTYVVGRGGRADEILYEADQRHVELAAAAYAIRPGKRIVATPLDKANFLARHPVAGTPLAEAAAAKYRSVCMRLLYVSADRPESQFAAKELSRAMATPTDNAEEHVKHVIRFIIGAPRIVWRYPRQTPSSQLHGHTDSSPSLIPTVNCTRTTM